MFRDDLCESDRAELEKFETYLRLVSEAIRAGVKFHEAVPVIYPDVYGDASKCAKEEP